MDFFLGDSATCRYLEEKGKLLGLDSIGHYFKCGIRDPADASHRIAEVCPFLTVLADHGTVRGREVINHGVTDRESTGLVRGIHRLNKVTD